MFRGCDVKPHLSCLVVEMDVAFPFDRVASQCNLSALLYYFTIAPALLTESAWPGQASTGGKKVLLLKLRDSEIKAEIHRKLEGVQVLHCPTNRLGFLVYEVVGEVLHRPGLWRVASNA